MRTLKATFLWTAAALLALIVVAAITIGPSLWARTDEWYSFANDPRDKGMHVLATVGENTCSPVMSLLFIHGNLRMGDHPIVWLHCIGTGGAFYSAIGHAASTYSEPKHLKLLEGGIAWAARLEGASCENRSESAPQ